MRSPDRFNVFAALWVLMAGVAAISWAAAPQAVSPGAVDELVVIGDGCPTFSWGAMAGISYYELVAYGLDQAVDIAAMAESELNPAHEVLYATIPGSATSWTPSTAQSLPAGGRYVWFLRGVVATEGGEVVDAGEWSQGRFFQVPSGPSLQEVHQALELLRIYLESDPESATRRARSGLIAEPSDQAGPAPAFAIKTTRSVPASTAAIRGELPDTAGESYGMVGLSASPNGAGLAAVNTAGGADLVLDGSEDGTTDTELAESGIYRSSTSAETFTIANPDTGTLSLAVEGQVEANHFVASGVFTGDGSGLSGISADDSQRLNGQLADFYRNASNVNAGTLGSAFYSAYGDLLAEGYLDNLEAGDLPTRSQADGRYVNLSGDTMTGSLVLSSGNLGIGTTTPDSLLEISAAGQPQIRLTRTDGPNPGSLTMTKGTDVDQAGATIASLGEIVIDSARLVVGTNADGFLEVDGIATFSGGDGEATINGDLYVTGSCTGCSSDLELKENITPLRDALGKITSLRGVYYDWSGQAASEAKAYPGRQIGVIAQEVEKVFPELVGLNSRGYKYVEYQRLIAPLIEAIKAQQGEIEKQQEQFKSQQARIAELKVENELLRQRIERLEEARQ